MKSNRPSKIVDRKFFLGYQKDWILDGSRKKLMEKSRQIGLSWSTAYRLVRECSQKEARTDAWISSRDDLQARLFIEDCKNFAKILNAAAKDLGERVVDEEKKISAYVLEFSSGVRIHSMSSNPDAQAGKRGSRVLDEFALHPDPRKLYSIAYPGITWGGNIEIISTHRGSANFFNGLVQEIKHKGNPKGFSLHTVTLQTALDQGFLGKLKSKLPKDDPIQEMNEAQYFDFIKAGCPDEETFLQEYMCQPSDDSSAFLTYELIDGCKYKAGELWDINSGLFIPSGNPLYLGGDIGRDHDLTVFWLLERVGGVFFTRAVIELKGKPFDIQEQELWRLLSLPGLRRVCLDQTGIGRMLVERAQKRFGNYKVEGVTFTPAVKEELAYPLRAAFEDRSLRIPDRQEITADLRAVKKETTAAGNIRFAADRGKNGHADRFWALALGLHAGKDTGVQPAPVPVHRTGTRQADRRERSVLA